MPSQTFRSNQPDLPETAPDVGALLKRRAAAPLKANQPQQPIEFGLFGDSHKQGELDL